MLQSLLTKIEVDLENRVDFVNLNKKIDMLDKKLQNVIINMQSQKNRACWEKLYWKKRQLVFKEFNKWQKIQTHKVIVNAKNDASSIASRSNYFNRVCRLNSSRDQLAFLLFFHVFLRSSQDRTTLQDMITLCTNNSSVTYCSSLRSKNDCCFVARCARKMKKYVACFFHFRLDCLNWLWYSIYIIFKWNYIYNCYRTDFINRYDFVELCFQCDEWFTNNLKWHEHYHNHLENLETLSIQCNSLFFRKTLVTVEQCIFCLFDSNLSSITRFYQFLNKWSWKEHLQKHFQEQKNKIYSRLQKLNKNKAVTCLDLRCALFFDSTQDFQFHCQDVHCVDQVKKITTKKRRCISQSKMNVIFDLYSNLESKHNHVFIEKNLFFKCACKITSTLTLESIDLVYSIELIESNEQSDDVRSLISSVYSANFKFFETNWQSRDTNLDVDTSALLIIFDSFIDSRLRDNLVSIISSTQ